MSVLSEVPECQIRNFTKGQYVITCQEAIRTKFLICFLPPLRRHSSSFAKTKSRVFGNNKKMTNSFRHFRFELTALFSSCRAIGCQMIYLNKILT